MTSTSNPSGVRAVLALARDMASVATLVYLVVSRVFYDDFGITQDFGADRFLLVIGVDVPERTFE